MPLISMAKMHQRLHECILDPNVCCVQCKHCLSGNWGPSLKSNRQKLTVFQGPQVLAPWQKAESIPVGRPVYTTQHERAASSGSSDKTYQSALDTGQQDMIVRLLGNGRSLGGISHTPLFKQTALTSSIYNSEIQTSDPYTEQGWSLAGAPKCFT